MADKKSSPQTGSKNKLSSTEQEELLSTLQTRFDDNPNRHPNLSWDKVQAKLETNPQKLWSLNEMENTGGEPDVVGQDKKTKDLIFYDCSAETPAGRRNVCYDREAQAGRKKYPPKNNALDMAAAMGVTLLNESEYRHLQTLGEFDLKTSCWIITPPEIRKLGGALFADRRYDHVFVYHNGADSYYSSRGWRGALKV